MINIKLKVFLSLLLLSFASQSFAFKYLTKYRVTATAYNSMAGQTDSEPNIAAWNNPIKPGDRIIAVSRDLLDKGLKNGVKVKIVGLPGLFTVRDKMNKRFTKRIDIYMGGEEDYQTALKWGKRRVSIIWDYSWLNHKKVVKANKKRRKQIRLASRKKKNAF